MEPVIDFEKGICSVCKKSQVSKWCDYITEYNHFVLFLRNYEDMIEANRRGASYRTCDLPMCSNCAKEVSSDTHLCPHHHHLHKQVELPEKYQRSRQKREHMKIQMESLRPSESETVKSKGQLNLFE